MTQDQLLNLYDQYADHVYRLALSYLRSPADAEDIVQTVFIKLLERKVSLPEGKEKTYLLTITANACKDLLRSSYRKRRADYEEAEQISVTDTFTSEEGDLFRAMYSISEKYRIAIHLHYYEGYTYPEIAKMLHISPSAVSMRIHRGCQELKQVLEKGSN